MRIKIFKSKHLTIYEKQNDIPFISFGFCIFTSCKNDAQTLASNSAQTEEYVGKEISTDHDAEIDKLISQMTLEEKSECFTETACLPMQA